MIEYNFDDFKRLLNIHDLLAYAGYKQDRRAGFKYPIYVKVDSLGQVVHGDKYMVTGRGNCCTRPGTINNLNIISFITENPTFFPQFRPGMSPHRLVNLVCNELLNNPIEHTVLKNYTKPTEHAPFNIENYDVFRFFPQSDESQQNFDPYFKLRGIDLYTLHTFKEFFFLARKKGTNNYSYRNLAFPLSIPGKDGYVGLEERGVPDKEGKAYKGKAAGSNGSEGLWIANLSNKPLSQAANILWFESAYDAMAYYQLHRSNPQMDKAVYISTGGNPTENQFKEVLAQTGGAIHYLCFDNDEAGRTFTANFMLVADGQRAGIVTATSNPELFTIEAVRNRLSPDTKVHVIPAEFNEYVSSMILRENILSGEPDLLPDQERSFYSKYESLCSELYSVRSSGMLSEDDYTSMKKSVEEAGKTYRQAMKEALGTGDNLLVMRPLPEHPYKDWNEQLLGTMEHREDLSESNSYEYRSHR